MLPPVSFLGEVAAPLFPFWKDHSLFTVCPQMPLPEGRDSVDLVHGRASGAQSVPGSEQVRTPPLGLGKQGWRPGVEAAESSR